MGNDHLSRRSSPTASTSVAKRLGKVASFSVSPEGLCWRGQDGGDEDLTHVIRYKDVLKWLKIHRRTLDYYIQRGYLKRVYGGGERAIGVSRDSYLKFIARRSGR